MNSKISFENKETVVEFKKVYKKFPGAPRAVLDEMDLKIKAENLIRDCP